MAQIKQFRDFMLLYNIEESTLIEVFSKSTLNLYKLNDIIFYQNSQPLNLYLVLKGEVCFKRYNNLDLLALISGEQNILFSVRNRKDTNSKMFKEKMLYLRYNALLHGKEDKSCKNISRCGQFFGEENLVRNTPYDRCAIVKEDSIILKININDFNLYLKKNIQMANENIRDFVFLCLPFFNKINKNQMKECMEKINKIFPKNGEIVCKENDLADKLYIIFQGKCVVQKNSKNLGNLLYNNRGDVFGYESLICLPKKYRENFKIKILNYEYTIVNKDDSSIILEFDIPFVDKFTTWKIYHDLINYTKTQINIIKNIESFKNISTKVLQYEHLNLAIRKKRNISSNKSNDDNSLKDIIKKDYKLFFNNKLASERNIINYKINKRKVNLVAEFIKKFPKDYFKPFTMTKINQIKKMDKKYYEDLINKDNKENSFNSKNNTNKGNIKTPIKINKNILTYVKIKTNEVNAQKIKQKSLIDINNLINNNKSSTFGKHSSYSILSTFVETKNLNKTIGKKSWKKLMKKCVTHKKIYMANNNKIYSRNDNKTVSKFEYKKDITENECLPFFYTPNSNGMSSVQTFELNKTNINKRNINAYNYPYISEDNNIFP